jgi:hypothetical protein
LRVTTQCSNYKQKTFLERGCWRKSEDNYLCLESDIANRFMKIAPFVTVCPLFVNVWSLPHVQEICTFVSRFGRLVWIRN